MKRISIVLSILILFAFISGCTNKETITTIDTHVSTELSTSHTTPSETEVIPNEEEKESIPADVIEKDTISEEPVNASQAEPLFKPGSPVSVFSEEDISYLKIQVSGTDREKAEAIRQWQIDNMVYASPESGFIDFSDPIRWNYFLPGIWPSGDIIYQHVKDGIIYGVCHDYAIIYCSIANYFGLETRVMNTLSKPSDSSDTPAMPGMHPDEYNRNKQQLSKYGLSYSYDAVSSVAEETPTHYWAEVKIDGIWVVMDGSQTSTGGNTETEFKATGDYEITDWMKRDKTALLNTFKTDSVTDNSGQTGRATGIGEIMQGYALAPYFNDARDAVQFINASGFFTENDINELNQDKSAYESCSGKKLHLVSVLICDGDGLEGEAWLKRYQETCGEEIVVRCASAIIGGD